MSRIRTLRAISVCALAVGLTACSGKGSTTSDEAPGVTDDTIRIGVLTDLTAVYGPLAKTLVQGNELYFDERNKTGGVCDRNVELVVRDHAHDAQKAVTQFIELEPEVLGFVQMLGSPMVAALAPRIADTNAITIPTSFSTDWLGLDGMAVTGTSYPVEVINGLNYLLEQGEISPGDTIGHVYFDGDFGANALTGTEFFAEQHDMTVAAVQVEPTTTELTAQVGELRNKDVSAIVVSAGPRQTASVAGLTGASGFDVPMLANGPGFDPALLDTPVGAILTERLHVLTPQEPFAGGSQESKDIASAYETKYPDAVPTAWVNFGYASAALMSMAVEQACENGELDRDGVMAALRSLNDATLGVMPSQDLTDASAMPSTLTYISKVDRSAAGGLTLVESAYGSTDGDAYGR